MNTILRIAAGLVAGALVAGCAAIPADRSAEAESMETVQPIASPGPSPAPSPRGPTTFAFDGELTQGGWLRGQAPGGTVSARLDDTPLAVDSAGRFFAAFDRDAGPEAELVAVLNDGREVRSPLRIAPRDWQIERVNVARRPAGTSEAFMQRRRPELARIEAARQVGADALGWSQRFIWPLTGRISGRFGSQRIYRGGEEGSYHSGIDVSTGRSGDPVVAPASGMVTLAATTPFSLEGHLLIIDHGQGLNSAFLHLSDIVVSEGQRVEQGQLVGHVGATGRATGPHLHWSLKWRDARLDPLLFTGPMP